MKRIKLRHIFTLSAAAIVMAVLIASPASASAQESASQTAFKPQLAQAELIVGLPVENAMGEPIGTVDDLLIDPKENRLTYVLVNYKEAYLLGGVFFAIPVSELVWNHPERTFVFNRYAQIYEEGGKWNYAGAENIAAYNGKVYVFYGPEPKTGQKTMTVTGFHAAKTSAIAELKERTVDWSRLEGAHVHDAAGNKVGELGRLYIDMHKGHVAYAAVNLSDADHAAVVPWSALKIDAGTPSTISLTKKSPGLSQRAVPLDELPSLLNLDEATELHETFGVEPYWQKYDLS